MKNPQLGARVPPKVQQKAKIKAAHRGQRLGEYITHLIEKDWKEGPVLVSNGGHNMEEE